MAVTSKVTRQASSKDLLAGKTDGVIVTSRGTIQLGRAAKVLATEFDGVWSVNSVVVSGGTIFIGTSPNGHVYRYSLGKLTKIYPLESDVAAEKPARRRRSPRRKPPPTPTTRARWSRPRRDLPISTSSPWRWMWPDGCSWASAATSAGSAGTRRTRWKPSSSPTTPRTSSTSRSITSAISILARGPRARSTRSIPRARWPSSCTTARTRTSWRSPRARMAPSTPAATRAG